MIYKYRLDDTKTVLDLPKGNKILTCQLQGKDLMIWVSFDTHKENDTIPETFHVVFTGHDFDTSGMEYISTVQTDFGLVFHVFKEIIS